MTDAELFAAYGCIPTATEVLAAALLDAERVAAGIAPGGITGHSTRLKWQAADRILAALPKGWALEPLCGYCGYPLRDWSGHACPGQ